MAAIYKTTTFLDALIHPEVVQLPYPILYGAAKFALWSLYTFWAGLVSTGVWVLAHECGHQAYSESKLVNNTVGWILHSAYAFPQVLVSIWSINRPSVSEFHSTHGVLLTANTTLPPLIWLRTRSSFPRLVLTSASLLSILPTRVFRVYPSARRLWMSFGRLWETPPLALASDLRAIWCVRLPADPIKAI